MFNREYLEMRKFVSQTLIFLKVSGFKAFDWWRQIAKRLCNGGAFVHQGPVPGRHKLEIVVAQIEVSMGLKMHTSSRVTPGNEHLGF